MPRVPIVGYALVWSVQSKTGEVALRLKDVSDPIRLTVNSAEEMAAVGVILNESPVFFITESKSVSTGWEEPGG